MKNLKLGYIGSGSISNFHIPVLKNLKFKISLFYSRNYDKALRFSKKHKIQKPEKNFKDFVNKINSVDGIVLSIKTDAVIRHLNLLHPFNKPIFIEKPGALKSSDLIKFKKSKNKKIFFLYNRRFYPSILEGKKFIQQSKNCFINLAIPDNVKNINQFITNGCHVIDILIFYFKNLKILKSYKLKKNIGYFFLMTSKNNDLISCVLNWGAPQNFEINICNEKNERLHIKPLEVARLYKGMKQIEPTKFYPIRSYLPKQILKKKSVDIKTKFKPGFLEQHREIKKIINNQNSKILTNLNDAIKVLNLIEIIIKKSSKKFD